VRWKPVLVGFRRYQRGDGKRRRRHVGSRVTVRRYRGGDTWWITILLAGSISVMTMSFG
jgi:hypothetical protein